MSISDINHYQARINEISSRFAKDMIELHKEHPEDFQGRSTLVEWSNQVWNAKIDLNKRIEECIEEVEELLHGGSYTHQFIQKCSSTKAVV
jgi:hypothetical protein